MSPTSNVSKCSKGPQGTLFGGGAEAGAVRYITAKPKLDTYEGRIEGSFGGTSGASAPNGFVQCDDQPADHTRTSWPCAR